LFEHSGFCPDSLCKRFSSFVVLTFIFAREKSNKTIYLLHHPGQGFKTSTSISASILTAQINHQHDELIKQPFSQANSHCPIGKNPHRIRQAKSRPGYASPRTGPRPKNKDSVFVPGEDDAGSGEGRRVLRLPSWTPR
jgi:hypothetical protein